MPRVFSRIMPVASGQGTREQKDNCAPRAFANVTGKDYNWIENKFRQAGRKDDKGTSAIIIQKVLNEFGDKFKFKGAYGTTMGARYWGIVTKTDTEKGMSLDKFIQQNPKGKFLILVRGHATTLIDGNIIDSFAQKGGSSVIAAWEYSE